MLSYRKERAESFILEELTLMLQNEVDDPRVALLTVSEVSLTKDRRVARVYIACYSGEEDLRVGMEGLESAKGFLRSRLGQLLHWRFAPELVFFSDRSWEYGAKIDKLFEQIEQEGPPQEDHDRDTD
jgi:ribosome-binding factor A